MGIAERITQRKQKEGNRSFDSIFRSMVATERQNIDIEKTQLRALTEELIAEGSIYKKLSEINSKVLAKDKSINKHAVVWTPGRGVALALVWGNYDINSYGTVTKHGQYEKLTKSFSIDIVIDQDKQTLIVKGKDSHAFSKDELKNEDLIISVLEEAFFYPSTFGYESWEKYEASEPIHASASD